MSHIPFHILLVSVVPLLYRLGWHDGGPEVHKVKDEATRELTKEVKDIVRENNEVSEMVAVLVLVQLEVVGEAMDIVRRLTRWSRRWPSFSEPKLTPGAPAFTHQVWVYREQFNMDFLAQIFFLASIHV